MVDIHSATADIRRGKKRRKKKKESKIETTGQKYNRTAMTSVDAFTCLIFLSLLFASGLGYMTGAYAGYLMGSWQWALRVSV